MLRMSFGAAVCLIAGQLQAATVTYTFAMTLSNNGASASGELVFSSPPASASTAWASASSMDLIDWTFVVDTVSFGQAIWTPADFSFMGYVLTYGVVQSFTGDALDAGAFDYDAPMVFDEPNIFFEFSPTKGEDSVRIDFFGPPGTSVGTYYGDWTVAPIPIPAAIWLFAATLPVILGLGRRVAPRRGDCGQT